MTIELLKTIFTTTHLIGVAIGAGGALYSDIIFFQALKDRKIDRLEFSFMRAISLAIWCGLILLILSGIGLFMSDPATYLASTKFLSKMLIVLIVLLNGILFHVVHIPFIKRRAKLQEQLFKNTPQGEDSRLVLSGIVSITSWMFALVLGSIPSISWDVPQIISIYLLILACGIVTAPLVMRKILSIPTKRVLMKIAILTALGSIILFLI